MSLCLPRENVHIMRLYEVRPSATAGGAAFLLFVAELAGLAFHVRLALAKQADDAALFDFAPVLRFELAELRLRKSVARTAEAQFQRQVDEVRLGQSGAVGANAVADEGRRIRVDAHVFDGFTHQFGLVFGVGDDGVVEQCVQTGLANLVLLGFAVTDGDCDQKEVVPGAGEDRQAVLEDFRLAEERAAADALADVHDDGVELATLGLAHLAVSFVKSLTEAVTLEASHGHAAVVDLLQNGHGIIEGAESAELHELGEFGEGSVPVGLTDNASAVDIDEKRRDLVATCAQVAIGRLTFAHSYLFSLQV